MDHPELHEDEKSVFEKKSTLRLIWIVLIGGCAVTAALGVFGAVRHLLHPHFAFDQFPVFYGALGFIAFGFIVLVGQHLRLIVMRDENYYGDLDTPGQPARTEASSAPVSDSSLTEGEARS